MDRRGTIGRPISLMVVDSRSIKQQQPDTLQCIVRKLSMYANPYLTNAQLKYIQNNPTILSDPDLNIRHSCGNSFSFIDGFLTHSCI